MYYCRLPKKRTNYSYFRLSFLLFILWLTYRSTHFINLWNQRRYLITSIFFMSKGILFWKRRLMRTSFFFDLYSHNIYLQHIYPCLYVNINLSFCVLHRSIFIKLCVRKVHIIMTPFVATLEIVVFSAARWHAVHQNYHDYICRLIFLFAIWTPKKLILPSKKWLVIGLSVFFCNTGVFN